MGCRVVCISRVTAAGGEAIGHAVSERLGFRYVDDEVITVAAETAGIDPAALENVEHEQGLFARLLEAIVTTPRAAEGLIARRPSNGYYDEAGPPPAPLARDELRQLIQGAIREIARRGEAVIVAHAASFALARQPDVLRVWVTASPEVRVGRLWIPNKLVSEGEYAKAVADSDRDRRRYLARFYDVDEELPTHYDLVLNTDRLSVDQAIATVVAAATA
jgi:cytidylate kinase